MSFVPDHVENPTAWLNAKAARIRANANKTRARALDVATANDSEEFRAWLHGSDTPELIALRLAEYLARNGPVTDEEHAAHPGWTYDDEAATAAEVAYERARKAWRKRVGFLPDFLREAMTEWHGLTEKQLDAARNAFAKNVERAAGRDAEENARRARAPHWTAGRQGVTGKIVTTREHETVVGRFGACSFTIKALLTLEDGRKLWTSLPRSIWASGEAHTTLRGQTIDITVTVEPSEDDASMGFGKRPSEGLPVAKAPKTPRVKKAPAPVGEPQEPRAASKIEYPPEITSPEDRKRYRAKLRRERAS